MKGTRHAEPVQRKHAAAPLRRAPYGEPAPPPSSGPQQALDASARVLSRVAQARALDARAQQRADVAQRAVATAPTGGSSLPGDLQEGLESASGLSLDGVRVHYDAEEPAQLQAHAYTRGDHIFLGPGQERHLPHEAWHAVQQRQGRVRPTTEVAGQAVNDAHALEREADVMGEQVLQRRAAPRAAAAGAAPVTAPGVVQRVFDPGRFAAALDQEESRYAAGLAAQSTDGAELYHGLSNLLAQTPQDAVTERLRKLRTVYERSATPWAKIQLLRVWSSFDHLERTRASGIPQGRQPDVMGLYDDFLDSAELMALRHQKENSGLFSWYGQDERADRHRAEIRALDARMRRAQNLALTHQVGIRNRPFPQGASADQRLAHQRNFSDAELQNLESVLGRLPAAHVAQNDDLRFFQRADVAEDADGAGAEYQPANRGVHVYDLGFSGRYRAAGSTSVLGEHPQGSALTSGEEVLAHEIGHSVEPQYGAASQALRTAAGWETYASAVTVRAALQADGLSLPQANAAIARLEAGRDRNYSQRPTETHNGHVYMVDPYAGAGFLRRTLNRMVGDPETTETVPQGGRSLVPYARSAPGEFFAELYSQAVHVPERLHENLVEAPSRRALAAADEVSLADGDAVLGPAARLAYGERRAQAAALREQWTVLREQVFGVNAQSEQAALVRLGAWADQQGISQANRLEPLADFTRDVSKAATPHQVDVLERITQAEMTRRQHPPVQNAVLQQRAAPVVQRRIAASGNIGTGRLSVDFEPHEPKRLPSHALERGHVTFEPGPEMRDTDEIQMEQIVRLDVTYQGLPDEHDLLLESQKTMGGRGSDSGFVVDQVPEGLDQRIVKGSLGPALAGGRAHFYAESGEVNETGLLSVLKGIDSEKVGGAELDALAREHGVTVPRLRLLRAWIAAQRSRGRLERLDADSLAAALAATARGDDPPAELAAATGLDAPLLAASRGGVSPELRKAKTRQDVVGWKKGAARQAAVLYDTPGSRTPARYFFKTAPYDRQHESYLGGYAEWGFEVELGPKGLARIKPGSEHVEIQDEMWDDYTATAKQAKRNFYDTWNRRNAERGFEQIGFDLYQKAGRYYVYEQGRPELRPLPEGTTREEIAHLLPPPPPRFAAREPSRSSLPDLPDFSLPELPDLPALEPYERKRAPRKERARDVKAPSRSLFGARPDLKVTGYGPGQLGVYFIDTPRGEIVVKPIQSVFSEVVALRIARELEIQQPSTSVERGDSPEGAAYVRAILASPHRNEYERHFASTPPKFFLVMDRVKGKTLEKALAHGVDDLPGHQNVDAFVEDLGRIAAFDILLYYRDRTSINGGEGGNLANLMVSSGDRLRAVAIDQRVNVRAWGILDPPVEEIELLVGQLMKGDDERLKRLWADLPLAIQTSLGGEKSGVARLRSSVVEGLKRVATRLNPELLASLVAEAKAYKLPPPPRSSFSLLPAASDDVDVDALIGSWKAIASSLKTLL